jgi:hypothetical protein
VGNVYIRKKGPIGTECGCRHSFSDRSVWEIWPISVYSVNTFSEKVITKPRRSKIGEH